MLVICASEPFHLTEMKERTRRTFTKNTFIHFHLFIHKDAGNRIRRIFGFKSMLFQRFCMTMIKCNFEDFWLLKSLCSFLKVSFSISEQTLVSVRHQLVRVNRGRTRIVTVKILIWSRSIERPIQDAGARQTFSLPRF
jgi:hypothetical protein